MTYAFDDTPSNISLNVAHKLLDLSLDLVLDLQYLASLDVQEAEGVDIVQSVEELRLGKGIFGVI